MGYEVFGSHNGRPPKNVLQQSEVARCGTDGGGAPTTGKGKEDSSSFDTMKLENSMDSMDVYEAAMTFMPAIGRRDISSKYLNEYEPQ